MNGRVRLELEPLEQRLLLDGNVIVSVQGNDVFVTGDGGHNAMFIRDTDDSLTIEGTDGTTVNGSAAVLSIARPISSISISLGDGNDIVEVDGIVVGADITCEGGSGHDQLLILSSLIGGSVLFLSGTGPDTFEVLNSAFGGDVTAIEGPGIDSASVQDSGIGGNLFIHTGLDLAGVVVSDSNVGGDLTVQATAGTLTVAVDPVNAGGNVTIDGGGGSLSAAIMGLRASGGLAVRSSGPVEATLDAVRTGGSVLVRSLEDALSTTLGNVGTLGSVFLSGAVQTDVTAADIGAVGSFSVVAGPVGGGSSSLALSNGRFGGNLNYLGTADGDLVGISTTRLSGDVNVNTGDGSASVGLNGLVIGGGAGLTAGTGAHSTLGVAGTVVRGSVSLVSSAASSELTLNVAAVGGGFSVQTGAGVDSILVLQSTVRGNTFIAAAANADLVELRNSLLNGDVLVATGAGSDTVRLGIFGDPSGDPMQFNGSFTALLGASDDDLLIGSNTGPGTAAVFNGPVFGAGGDGTDTLDIEPGVNTFTQVPTFVGFEDIV